MFPYISNSVDDTIAFGKKVAAHLNPGDVVALYGNLGAGKTHFVKGIASGLGYTVAAVTSPTYTLISEHKGQLVDLYHFDAYRLRSAQEIIDIGFIDYLGAEGICVLEWPEKVADVIPTDAIRIRVDYLGTENERSFELH